MKRARYAHAQIQGGDAAEEFVTFETRSAAPAIQPRKGTLWFQSSALASGRGAFKYAETNATNRVIPDYDTGTFTPNLLYGATAVTMVDADGVWIRVGNLVTVTCHLVWSVDITAGTTSTLSVDNMPFSKNSGISTLTMPVGGWQQLTSPNAASMACRFTSSAATLHFVWTRIDGADMYGVSAQESDASGTKVIGFSITYPIAELT